LWGLAQLRAGRLKEAVETLEGSLHTAGWQWDGCVWPLLAIAYHQLGNSQLSGKCFNQSAQRIALYEKVPPTYLSQMMGPGKILPEDWLAARVFYREAKELIEGGGKPQLAAGSKPQPAPAANPQPKNAKPPAPKPPLPPAASTEKPKEKQEKNK
jgi:hypothetical protein